MPDSQHRRARASGPALVLGAAIAVALLGGCVHRPMVPVASEAGAAGGPTADLEAAAGATAGAAIPDAGSAALLTDPTLLARLPPEPPGAADPSVIVDPTVIARIPPEPPVRGRACDGRGRPFREAGTGTFYGKRFHGRRTASGERFDMHKLTAAHRWLPFGTRVKVTNRENGRSVVVRVTDRHAAWNPIAIDVSREAANRLAMRHAGEVEVQVVAICG